MSIDLNISTVLKLIDDKLSTFREQSVSNPIPFGLVS